MPIVIPIFTPIAKELGLENDKVRKEARLKKAQLKADQRMQGKRWTPSGMQRSRLACAMAGWPT